jgi:hypothetical protein
MDDDRHSPRWFERVTSADFCLIAGPVLLFLAIFVLVLID